MIGYSSDAEIQALLSRLGNESGSILVSDFDGTLGVGYEICQREGNLWVATSERITLSSAALHDASQRDAAGYLPLSEGKAISPPQIFAPHQAMNVYALPPLVQALTMLAEAGQPQRCILNTGRTEEQLREILLQSGMETAIYNQLYTVTNHGSELALGQQQRLSLAPAMPQADAAFLHQMANDTLLHQQLRELISEVLQGEDKNPQLARLMQLEVKRASGSDVSSVGFHYAPIIYATKAEGLETALNLALTEYLQDLITAHENTQQQASSTRLPLEVGQEAGILEIRRRGFTKGDGMAALMQILSDTGQLSESCEVLFAGDSMLGEFGRVARTDYPAAIYLKSKEEVTSDTLPYQTSDYNIEAGMKTAISQEITGKTIYIHHPDSAGKPKPSLAFPADYPAHLLPDITLATPMQFSALISHVLVG